VVDRIWTRTLAVVSSPVWHWLSAVFGVALALVWYTVMAGVDAYFWWRASMAYDGMLILTAGVLLACQILSATSVPVALVLTVFRPTRAFGLGFRLASILGVAGYLAVDHWSAKLIV
jgi:hypothetical protein